MATVLIPRGGALMSVDGRYRYRLTRRIGPGLRIAAFIMLNPSTADADVDDPTIRRCIGFARRWGCGHLIVVNLFAFRATSPRDMMAAADPVGPDNHEAVVDAAEAATQLVPPDGVRGRLICAWGAHGGFMDQDRTVMGWLDEIDARPEALGLTKHGHPRHPLYVPADAEPVPFAGRL